MPSVSVPSGFELFDHTADLGVRAHAASRSGLVDPATAGLYACVGQLVPGGDAQPVEFVLEPAAPSDPGACAALLRDFLAEVLHVLETRRRMLVNLRVVEFSPLRLHVRAQSVALDAARSDAQREVKAVTYHALSIVDTRDGCEATFIVDI